MTSILMDGAHFLSKTATGIGSYARTLAATLQESGCHVAVLYGQRVQPRRHDLPLSLAAQVFGNVPPRGRWRRLIGDAAFVAGAAIGRGARSSAVCVPVDGVDLSAFDPPLPQCDLILNADGVFERAYRLFSLKHRLLEVDVPVACKAAHWTTPLAVKARGMPNIYTLHDLIPLQFPHFVIDFAGRSVQLHAVIARQADHIVTDSVASKQRIVELLNVPEDRVSVTYTPVPSLPRLAREDAERLVETVYGARPGEYALYLGAVEPRKNLKRLIEAFLLARVNMPLLIAGPLGWLYDEDLALIDKVAGHAPDAEQPPVRRLGYLPRRHVVALLQCARFLVFPSICEGFGLPVLEAMQLGVPVLTSKTSSLPEVAGQAAILVDPLNVAEMAQEIRRLASDGDLCAELAARGPAQAARFSREAFQERLAAAYRRVGVEIGSGTTTGEPRPATDGIRNHREFPVDAPTGSQRSPAVATAN